MPTRVSATMPEDCLKAAEIMALMLPSAIRASPKVQPDLSPRVCTPLAALVGS